MKPTAFVLFSGVLALAAPAPAADHAPAEMPLVLVSPGEPTPFWRDARTFGAGDATPPLAPAERDALRALLARPADRGGCIHVGTNDVPEYALGPHRPSFAGEGSKLARLMRASTWTLVARVVAASPGIADGIPATLLEVAPRAILHGTKSYPGQRQFVIVPVATVEIAGKRLCKSSDAYQSPEVGEEILLFVSDVRGASGEVFRVSQLQLIRLPEKEGVRFPWTLDTVAKDEAPKERGALVDYLRGIAKGLEAEAGSRALVEPESH